MSAAAGWLNPDEWLAAASSSHNTSLSDELEDPNYLPPVPTSPGPMPKTPRRAVGFLSKLLGTLTGDKESDTGSAETTVVANTPAKNKKVPPPPPPNPSPAGVSPGVSESKSATDLDWTSAMDHPLKDDWFRPDDENDMKEPVDEEEKKMKEFFFLVGLSCRLL